MANRFQIDVTARDKTAEGLRSVNDNFARLTKGTGLEKVTKGFGEIEQRGRSFGSIARTLFTMGDAARVSGGGLGEAAGAMSDAAAAAGVLGLGTAAVGAGLAAATVAAFKFEDAYSKIGARTGRFADVLGMPVEQVQRFELAGKHFHVTAQGMDSALQGVGNTMQDAMSGRNQTALALMTRLGIKVHYLKNGAVDAGRGMLDLAGAMQRSNPQTQQMIAAQFGLGSAMNFVIAKAADRERVFREVDASGAVRTKKQTDAERRFQETLAATEDKWDGLLNAFSTNVTMPWLQPLVTSLGILGDELDRIVLGTAKWRFNWKTGDFTVAGTPAAPTSKWHVNWRTGDVTGSPSAPGASAAAPVDTTGVPQAAPGAGRPSFFRANRSVSDRNNNPGNLTDGSGHFRHFATRAEGYAAMARQLEIDFHRHGQHTVEEIINDPHHGWSNQWAPGNSEASSRNYIRRVARSLGVAPDAQLNLDDPAVLSRMMQAMNEVERGPAVSGGAAANGHVHVDVHIKGAAPGTVVSASAAGQGVTVGARIAPSMPGGPV